MTSVGLATTAFNSQPLCTPTPGRRPIYTYLYTFPKTLDPLCFPTQPTSATSGRYIIMIYHHLFAHPPEFYS